MTLPVLGSAGQCVTVNLSAAPLSVNFSFVRNPMLEVMILKSEENNDMRKNTLKSLVAVAALAVMISPVFAGTVQRIITVNGVQKVSGKELKNDDYTFKIDDAKLTVELRHKVVAEATGKWEARDTKYDTDTVITDADGKIQEIRLGGQKRAFVVSGN